MQSSFAAATQPISAPLRKALKVGRERHTACLKRLANATANAIDITTVPADTLLIRTDRFFQRVFVLPNIRYTRLTTLNSKREVVNYKVNEDYLIPSITIGVVWGKPSVRLVPIPGVTPDNWLHFYPPFHFRTPRNAVCIGYEMPIGQGEDDRRTLSALRAVLSTVNMTDPIYTLSTLGIEGTHDYHKTYTEWAKAEAMIRNGQATKQKVFKRSKTMQLI